MTLGTDAQRPRQPRRSSKGQARSCRLCGGRGFVDILTLGDMPVSHHLRRNAGQPDPRFTLDFACCEGCGLLQIVDPIPAELIYRDADSYTTGFQKPRHLDDLIATAIARQDPGSALDVGCNDGALMDALRLHGYLPVVGVEPNATAAALAAAKGHEVARGFLDGPLAARLRAQHGGFGAVYLRHVAEHVPDLAGFFAALRAPLREDGLLVIELPDVEAGLALGNPAILWEEHVSYFTAPLAAYLIESQGFQVLEERRYAFGGGSLAYVAEKQPLGAVHPPPRPAEAIALMKGFAGRLQHYAAELRRVVELARTRGRRVAIYGAAPRSAVVACACGIAGQIDFVIDDRADIQGRLMPGTNREIRALPDIVTEARKGMLCLMGVGAENEFKVRTKLEAALGTPVICVSLFPPRDTLKSIAHAASALGA